MKAIVCSLAVVAAVPLLCRVSWAQTPAPARDGRTLRQWIERTDDRDDAVREDAAIAIGKLGPDAKVAVPRLSKLLDEDEVRARAFAMGPAAKAAVPELMDELDDPMRSAASRPQCRWATSAGKNWAAKR